MIFANIIYFVYEYYILDAKTSFLKIYSFKCSIFINKAFEWLDFLKYIENKYIKLKFARIKYFSNA